MLRTCDPVQTVEAIETAPFAWPLLPVMTFCWKKPTAGMRTGAPEVLDASTLPVTVLCRTTYPICGALHVVDPSHVVLTRYL